MWLGILDGEPLATAVAHVTDALVDVEWIATMPSPCPAPAGAGIGGEAHARGVVGALRSRNNDSRGSSTDDRPVKRDTTTARDRAVMSKWWLPELGRVPLGRVVLTSTAYAAQCRDLLFCGWR